MGRELLNGAVIGIGLGLVVGFALLALFGKHDTLPPQTSVMVTDTFWQTYPVEIIVVH